MRGDICFAKCSSSPVAAYNELMGKESIIVMLLVAAAVYLLGRQVWRSLTGRSRGCGSCGRSCHGRSDNQCEQPEDDSA